jgi:hypothetical protein
LLSIVGGVAGYSFSPQVAAVLAGAQRVAGPITTDTTWSGERTHVLTERVYVTDGARLTIEAGARIRGEPGSALIVGADASLHARGARKAPITFTSAQAPGKRAPGDWGGLVLLGRAPVNATDPRVEGIADDAGRARYGGTNPDDSCGALEYVRIAHAGYELAANDELNGLTLAGCGGRSLVGHVQVRQSLDDGIEVFGGNADLKYLVVAGAGDDSLDWDQGWRGRAQHVLLVQSAERGDNAVEADNNREAHRAQPRSAPTLANVTLLSPPGAQGQRRALLLRRGTGLDLRNTLVAGFNHELLDLRDKATGELAASGALTLRGLVASEIGSDGHTWTVTEQGGRDDDAGFNEGQLLRAAGNRLGVDLRLPETIDTADAPPFAPDAAGAAARAGVALPEGELWNRDAQFAGAVRPGRGRGWLADWTAWPSD